MILPVAAALLLLSTPVARADVVIRYECEAVASEQPANYKPQTLAEMRISAAGEATLTRIEDVFAPDSRPSTVAASVPPEKVRELVDALLDPEIRSALAALAAAAPPQGNACERFTIEVRGLTFRFNPFPWTDREFREILDLLWRIHRFAGEVFPHDYGFGFICTPEQWNDLNAFRCGNEDDSA